MAQFLPIGIPTTRQKRHPPNLTKMLSIKNSTILHIWSAVYRLFLPVLMVSMKYPFPLVILMWAFLFFFRFLLLYELCTSVVIWDLSRWDWCAQSWKAICLNWCCFTDTSCSRDDNRLVEFLTIHMLLTPLRLVLVLQYLISPSFTVVNTLVSKHDKPFVVDLMEPAIKQCLKGTSTLRWSSHFG